MAAEFGGRWQSQAPTPEALAALKIEWGPKVADLTPEEIRRGLDAMPVGEGAWPPGPRAFRKLCRPVDTSATLACEAHRLYLPAPARSREEREAARVAAQAQLAELREKLPAVPDPESAQALPCGVPSLADRRAFIERNRDALVAAGLAAVADIADAQDGAAA